MSKEIVRIINQRHPPRRKSGTDVELNKTCTIIKKDGTVSSVEGYGTENACKAFVNSIYTNAKNLDIKLVSKYKILKHKV